MAKRVSKNTCLASLRRRASVSSFDNLIASVSFGYFLYLTHRIQIKYGASAGMTLIKAREETDLDLDPAVATSEVWKISKTREHAAAVTKACAGTPVLPPSHISSSRILAEIFSDSYCFAIYVSFLKPLISA